MQLFGAFSWAPLLERESKRRIKRLRGISNPDYRLRMDDFLLERSPRFRKMLNRVKQEKGGMPLAAYRQKRRL